MSTTGIKKVFLGDTSSSFISLHSTTNYNQAPTARSIEIYGGQLYGSFQSTFGSPAISVAMAAIGTGDDTTTGKQLTNFVGVDTVYASAPTTKASPYQFVILNLPGGQVLYIADNATGGAIVERGIQKYSLVSGTWVYNGSIYAKGCVGLTGYNSGDTVALFATSSTKLFGAADIGGFNNLPICPTDSAVALATAPKNTGFRGVAFTPGTPTNLAVTLKSDLTGSLVNGYAHLSWSTANEINSKSFEIEKSVDGKSFTAVGSVPANNKPSTYTFADPTKVAGVQYYRLRMINNDGSYAYGKTVALSDKVAIKLGIFPNPAVTSTATITHPVAASGAFIKISSIDGRLISTHSVQTGATQTSVDVSRLAKGSYIVSFESNNAKTTVQFVK